MKLSRLLVGIIGLLVLVGMILGGITNYYLTKQTVGDRIVAQLESVAVLKENNLHSFINSEASNLRDITTSSTIKNNLFSVVSGVEEATLTVRQRLEDYLQNNPGFIELFILDPDGKILVSTNLEQEGKIKFDQEYFIRGRKDISVGSFYYDLNLGSTMVIALPLENDNERRLGVLAGRINTGKISEIMIERAGLGDTGETYLVNRNNLLISPSRFLEGAEFKKRITSEMVKECLGGDNGFGRYTDYRGSAVVSVYRWLDERKICLIAEIDESEAFAPIKRNIRLIFLTSLIIFVIVAIVGLFSSRLITSPLSKIGKALDKITKGRLNIQLGSSSITEIQSLIDSLNRILTSLKLAVKKVGVTRGEIGLGEALKAKKEAEEMTHRKIEELKRFSRLAIGREKRMLELKKKIAELEKQIGKRPAVNKTNQQNKP